MAFIVFEGLDACGKSTQIERLKARLSERQITSVVTREPGGTELGEELRALLLRVEKQPPVPRAELLIYEACRSQLVEMVIKPALAKNQWVLSDRYQASSIAFQSGGRGLSRPDVDSLNQFATEGLQPDVTILVNVSVETSLQRKNKREADGQKLDRFELEKVEFHTRVFESYQEQCQQSGWLVVDGEKPVDEVAEQIWQGLEARQCLK